tara:strand:+ start:5721 stop:6710 length:990 start_codon:yes stop_codon:yes gene_type:complete
MKTVTYSGKIEKRNKPINLKKRDEKLFEHEINTTVNDSFVQKISNPYLLRKNIFKITSLNFYLDHTYMNKPVAKNFIKLVFTYFKYFLKPKESITSGFWVINNKSENYFHWMTESLTRIFSFKKLGIDSTLLLPEQFKSNEFVLKTLEILNINFKIYSNNKLLKVKELYLTSHTAIAGNYNSEIIYELQRELNKGNHASSGKRYWISRRYAARRHLNNEEKLYDIFEEFDIEIIYPEKIDFYEQIKLFRNAEFIGGIHGAGLVNMLFMEMGNSILEIRDKNDRLNNCYFSLSSVLKHKFYYLLSENDSMEILEIDPNKLKEIFSLIFKE